MKIGITDCQNDDKFEQYERWMRTADPAVVIARLSHSIGADQSRGIDGLLLTGGGDVDPEFYGATNPGKYSRGVDRRRDEYELQLIRESLEDERPILAVCRGMQIMNVALGGTLIDDLVSEGYDDHAGDASRRITHEVTIEANSLMSGLAGGLGREVNSSHHQAVRQLGRGLMPVARTADGVIEAAEWSLKEGMPFLLLVQWHPERMYENEFSTNLAKIFLRETQYYTANKTT